MFHDTYYVFYIIHCIYLIINHFTMLSIFVLVCDLVFGSSFVFVSYSYSVFVFCFCVLCSAFCVLCSVFCVLCSVFCVRVRVLCSCSVFVFCVLRSVFCFRALFLCSVFVPCVIDNSLMPDFLYVLQFHKDYP